MHVTVLEKGLAVYKFVGICLWEIIVEMLKVHHAVSIKSQLLVFNNEDKTKYRKSSDTQRGK